MPEVPIAEAIEQAQAEVASETPIDDGSAETFAAAEQFMEEMCEPPQESPEPAAPTQPELFPPPPAPPFDFQKAYDECRRLDLRAKAKKTAWELRKGDARDAKEEYDEAIEALHQKFDEVDRALKNAGGQVNQSAAMAVAFATVAEEQQNATTEGGDRMPDVDETQDVPTPEPVPPAETPEPPAPTDASATDEVL